MATYEKITLASFKKKLEAKGYKNLTGARRAVGRMTQWSEEDRQKARTMADRFFGAQAPAKKTASKKVEKPKKAAKEAVKKEAKKAPKAAKAKAAKGKSTRAKGQRRTHVMSPQEALNHIGRAVVPNADLQDANYTVGTIQNVLTTLKVAKELGAPEVGVIAAAKASQQALLQVVTQVMHLTGLSDSDESEDTCKKAEAFRNSVPGGNSGNKKTEATSVPQPAVSSTTG